MKILLVSMNAKYEHEGLAVWYLAGSLPEGVHDVHIVETTINDDPMRAFAECVRHAPDLIGLSCYVWNRDRMAALCSDLHRALPDCHIAAGGPEMNGKETRDAFLTAGADTIIRGEGELPFSELVALLAAGQRPTGQRLDDWLQGQRQTPVEQIPSPFAPEHLERLKGRIAYVEASRGCPFHCTYCLSSESGMVRPFPLDRVKQWLLRLMDSGAGTVKFVDRTFNVDTDRLVELCGFLAEHAPNGMRFHFEVAPDLLNGRQLEALAQLPPGLVQIEAGIQSIHEKTLAVIRRNMNMERAMTGLSAVLAEGNVHVHADLIAGLPHETAQMFRESFDRLHPIGVHHLQLGFLKVLSGTAMARQAAELGFVVRDHAPYEVISTDGMTALELLALKDFEETTERFLNSGRFERTMRLLAACFDRPHQLIDALAAFQVERGLMVRAVAPATLYRTLLEFGLERVGRPAWLRRELAIDFVRATGNTVLPDWMEEPGSEPVLQVPEAEFLLDLFGSGSGMEAHELSVERILRMSAKERRRRFALFPGSCLVDVAGTDPVNGLSWLISLPVALQ